ncbi:MAG: hypothetical protein HQL87_00900 [Magnetococcales bacterium]|nr:hypothetical protein [Magnetococcales bacterium]
MTTTLHDLHPVTHSWHVGGLSDVEARAALTAWLQGTCGILDSALDVAHGTVKISYDLWQVTAEQVESALSASHLSLCAGFMDGLKRNWILFTEKNERDNLTFTPVLPNRPVPLGRMTAAKKGLVAGDMPDNVAISSRNEVKWQTPGVY